MTFKTDIPATLILNHILTLASYEQYHLSKTIQYIESAESKDKTHLHNVRLYHKGLLNEYFSILRLFSNLTDYELQQLINEKAVKL